LGVSKEQKELALLFNYQNTPKRPVPPGIWEKGSYARQSHNYQIAGPYKKEIAMKSEQTAHETKGVTVKPLASVDLGPEIEGMAGRQLRMRIVTMEPGAVFGPIHDHKNRPGLVYILQGTITDHRDGESKDYGPGLGWPEDRNTLHWLENRGPITAVEVSVDIVSQ